MSTTNRKLRVFLCHSSQDKPIVRQIYQRLLIEGWIDPWLDEVKILAGQDFHLEINKATRNADVIIICLSSVSVIKEGFVNREIRQALDIAQEKREGEIYIVPLRLDDCDPSFEQLKKLHWVNYFEEDGYERLKKSLQQRFERLGEKIKANIETSDDSYKSAYFVCPVCNRNDRCEKITKFSRELQPPQNDVPSKAWYLLPLFVWVPFWGQLPLWLSPIRNKKKMLTLLVLVCYLTYFGVAGLMFSAVDEPIAFTIGGLATAPVVYIFLSNYFAELGSVITDKTKLFSIQTKEYKNAKETWKTLYYCHRDDCVFDPLSKKYTPIEDLSKLLGLSYKLSIDVEKGRI